ncbi:MAG: hypothetical protein ACBZ72_00430 [Candidatus Bathyarchaeia archaeon]|jgi:hypothetical protein
MRAEKFNKLLFVTAAFVILLGTTGLASCQSYPVDVSDGEFTGYPGVNEWAGYEYSRANPTDLGSYGYYIYQNDYIYMMHDIAIDVSPNAGDFNYFKITFADGAVMIITVNVDGTASLLLDGSDVTTDPEYDFAAGSSFGPSPNSDIPHRMYEIRVRYTSAPVNLIGVFDKIEDDGDVLDFF